MVSHPGARSAGSIARNYPIGSLLLWRSPLDLASERSIAGLDVDVYEGKDEPAYLLDGCQRLSTICGALYWEPHGDPESYWNLVYDLQEERFLHRHDLDDAPKHQIPLRFLVEPSDFFQRVMELPREQQERARVLFNRFTKYEVAVVTLEATSFTEVGRIFERVNTRGTPLTTIEFVRAATWRDDFDLLDAIDRVREALARKHYGHIERKLLLRSIAAAAGLGFATRDIENLPNLDPAALPAAIAATEDAARRAVDFLTTEIGTPTAEALPYPNQLAVVIEIFRRLPKPNAHQFAALRSWFWKTALSGYYEGWNARKMADDLAAVIAFTQGATKAIEVDAPALSSRYWFAQQYRRDSSRTKAFALMLAAAGPRDLRTGQKIDAGRALAQSNDMEYHHFFPKAWLTRGGFALERANSLLNIVMLTSISNRAVSDQPPAAYLQDEIDFSGEEEIRARLDSLLISPQAFDAAMAGDYQSFLAARGDTILAWALELAQGGRVTGRPATPLDPEVARHLEAVEIMDTDTDD
ncbi:GmrSD restriction endonuclease domain-containing protein [Spirillospora albida]|uniref:GmrSD restriction endonuclease domain-containing protein n=1 Tax=Spirillospora albida TaxID=58123 RepID=UPI00147011DD|nr:DUF262 domain-containing protein [Spirillospora albida]